MCECGCTSGNKMYSLPGPNGAVYVLMFQPACRYCCGPDAVLVQRWASKKALEGITFEPVPALPFMKRSEEWDEAVILTGRTHEEFVKALRSYLVGVSSSELMGGESDKLDEIAADVILDEMYGDSTFTPRLLAAEAAGGEK